MRFNDFSAGNILTSLALGLALVGGCGTSSPPATTGTGGATGTGGSGSGGTGTGGTGSGGTGTGGSQPTDGGGTGGSGGAVADGGGDAPVAMMPIPGTCQPPVDPLKPYEKLSQTGCMDPTDVKKMHPTRVFAYEVNAPLWSDAANKTRGIALPPNGKIHVKNCAGLAAGSLKMGDECCVVDPNAYPACLPPADDGRWVMPVGTVVVKNFLFDNKLVETRLFVRQSDKKDSMGKFLTTDWVGYSYQWNKEQTEATIVGPDRASVMFDTGMRTVAWNYPSRMDCMTCHNEGVGYFIGTESAQLNRVVGGMNQLDKMKAAGMFENAPATWTKALVTPYTIAGQVTVTAGATTEEKALAYLHSNCSYCHRPDGTFYSMDFRRDVAMAARGACNADPMKGNFSMADAKVIVPATPAKSVMYLRMNSLVDKERMPQIGTVVVDTNGTALISQWITSIKTCPAM